MMLSVKRAKREQWKIRFYAEINEHPGNVEVFRVSTAIMLNGEWIERSEIAASLVNAVAIAERHIRTIRAAMAGAGFLPSKEAVDGSKNERL